MKKKLLVTLLATALAVSTLVTGCGSKDVSKMTDAELYTYLMKMDETKRDDFIDDLDTEQQYRANQVLLLSKFEAAAVEDDFQNDLSSDSATNTTTEAPTLKNDTPYERSSKWDEVNSISMIKYCRSEYTCDIMSAPTIPIQVGNLFITPGMSKDEVIEMIEAEGYEYEEAHWDKGSHYLHVANDDGTWFSIYYGVATEGLVKTADGQLANNVSFDDPSNNYIVTGVQLDVTNYPSELADSDNNNLNFSSVRVLDGILFEDLYTALNSETRRAYLQNVADKYNLEFSYDEDKRAYIMTIPNSEDTVIFYNSKYMLFAPEEYIGEPSIIGFGYVCIRRKI